MVDPRTLRRGLLCAFVASALVGSGCGRAGAAPLEHTQGSPVDLARSVLDAVARADRTALERLAISDREFRERVWPALPASRPERNLPLDYVWGDLRQKSAGHLSQTLAQHGGRRYSLVDVAFLGETTPYANFEVLRKAQLRIRDDEGEEQVIRLFGSVLRSGSEYKIFSWVVD
jgi:hypothetical protein